VSAGARTLLALHSHDPRDLVETVLDGTQTAGAPAFRELWTQASARPGGAPSVAEPTPSLRSAGRSVPVLLTRDPGSPSPTSDLTPTRPDPRREPRAPCGGLCLSSPKSPYSRPHHLISSPDPTTPHTPRNLGPAVTQPDVAPRPAARMRPPQRQNRTAAHDLGNTASCPSAPGASVCRDRTTTAEGRLAVLPANCRTVVTTTGMPSSLFIS